MSTPKRSKTIQPPQLPKNLNSSLLPAGKIEDYGEYINLRITGEHWANQSAEQIILKGVWFKQVLMEQMRLLDPKMSDLRCENCDLANATWERAILHRVEILGCRMTGFKAVEAYLQDVRFQDCLGAFAQFRFAAFKSVHFEQCNLVNADFQGSNLSYVRFANCDLTNAEMSHTTLVGTDFRGSKIDNLKVGARELPGAIVDHFQAAYLASLLGIVIKDEHEE